MGSGGRLGRQVLNVQQVAVHLAGYLGAEKPFLGREQLDWLKRELKASQAQWKVIAADMPIGLGVPDGEVSPGVARWEAIANNHPGAPQGRELEIAELLGFLRAQKVRNHVWLTADVHYCAAHHYHPDRAAFQDFEPFWEFVAGPLNAFRSLHQLLLWVLYYQIRVWHSLYGNQLAGGRGYRPLIT